MKALAFLSLSLLSFGVFAQVMSLEQPHSKLRDDTRACDAQAVNEMSKRIFGVPAKEISFNAWEGTFARIEDGPRKMRIAFNTNHSTKDISVKVNDIALFRDNPFITRENTQLYMQQLSDIFVHEVALNDGYDSLGNPINSRNGEQLEVVVRNSHGEIYNGGLRLKDLKFPAMEYISCLKSVVEKNSKVYPKLIDLKLIKRSHYKMTVKKPEACPTTQLIVKRVDGDYALINGMNLSLVVINGEDLSNEVPVNLTISAKNECNLIVAVKGCGQESKSLEINCYGQKNMTISIFGE